MQKTLFRIAKQAISIARKLTDAAVIQISHSACNRAAGWKHNVLHSLRHHMEATLQEVLDWAEEMERVRAVLALERGEFPDPTTFCKSSDQVPIRIWRELFRLSSELLDQSYHAAIDRHLLRPPAGVESLFKCCDRDVRTTQAMFLVDSAQSAVIDVLCSAEWPNGTKTGPQVARRNAGDLLILATEKATTT